MEIRKENKEGRRKYERRGIEGGKKGRGEREENERTKKEMNDRKIEG